MKKTNIYGFGYLEASDRTGEMLDMDQIRFLAIENNLLHLYTIFGNGVLEDGNTASWLIQPPTDTTGLSVYITPGEGHVAWKYAKTTSNINVELSYPVGGVYPITYWIYATPNATTPELSTVDFVASLSEINDPNYYIGLGAVEIDYDGSNFTYTVHNTADYGRVVISLFETLNARINAHKHIGGSRNPSPIDLGAHVQGKLSGTFLSDLDASTVTSGTFAPERIPQIDHETLSNKGTLTHSEIDSLLAELQDTSAPRLSDIFIANMLQLAIALKKQAGLSDVDKNLINAIFYLPGYNENDSFVSWYSTWAADGLTGVARPYVPVDVTLATIDKANHQIVGGTGQAAISDFVVWTTNSDFSTAYAATDTSAEVGTSYFSRNIEIFGTTASSYFTLSKPYAYSKISDSTINTTSGGPWKYNHVFASSSLDGNSDISLFEYLYTLFSGDPRDYSGVNKLAIGYTVNLPDNPSDPRSGFTDIYAYLILSDGTGASVSFLEGDGIYVSDAVLIHDASARPNAGVQYYTEVNMDSFIASANRSQVVGFGFYYNNDFEFKLELNVPTTYPGDLPYRVSYVRQNGAPAEGIFPDLQGCIFAWNDIYYNQTGTFTFRFDGNTPPPLYNKVTWDIVSNSGSYVVKTRTKDTHLALNGALPYDVSQTTYEIDSRNNTGRFIDVIVLLTSSSDRLSSPTVNSIQLHFTSISALAAPKVWTSNADFITGRTFTNIINPPANNRIQIDDTSEVGYFNFIKWDEGLGNYSNGFGSTENNNLLIGLSDLYTTPVQAFNHSVRKGLESPRDVYQTVDNHYIFADTANDRVVEVDQDGYFVRAIQGNLRLKRNNRDLVALTAQYNSRLGKMWISFSQYINFSNTTDALKKVSVSSGVQVIGFDNTGRPAANQVKVEKFSPVTPLNSTTQKSATLVVTFTGSLKTQIDSWSSDIFLNIGTGFITTDGNDGVAYSSGSTSSDNNDGTDLPSYIDGDTKLYEIVGSGTYAQTEFVSYLGLLTESSTTTVDGDFNFNGAIDSDLIGPESETPVKILVFVGEVVFDNIYSPVSSQVIESNNWVVAMVGENSIKQYNNLGETIDSKTISKTFVEFTEGKGGSAYLYTPDPLDLTSRNLLVAAPALSPSTNGKVLLINQTTSGNNTLLATITTVGVDAVRALPDPDNLYFWVALDDVTTNGTNSRLVKYDVSGRVRADWSGAIHPVGLQFTPNGDILISE